MTRHRRRSGGTAKVPKGGRKKASKNDANGACGDRQPSLYTQKAVRYLGYMLKRLSAPAVQKAIGYARVSTEKQADKGSSLAGQRDRIADYCTTKRLDLVFVYHDAVSGAKTEDKRPGLGAAIDAIRRGEASHLVVTEADRFSRDSDVAGHTRVEIKKAGGELLVIANEGESEEVRLLRDFIAQVERNRIKARMKTWSAARRSKGLPMGFAPYGFRQAANGRFEPVPAEQPVLRRIAARRKEGASLRRIADELNADAVPTRTGKGWNATTIAAILRRSKKEQ